MPHADNVYLGLLSRIMNRGNDRGDRTGTGTRSLFGEQIRFDLQEGFPLLTTKKMFWKGIVGELMWFLRGRTDVRFLNNLGIHIWDEWADEHGNCGPIYGYQWRHWETKEWEYGEPTHDYVDQIAELVTSLRENPESRRHIVSAWNVVDLEEMGLPPCHVMFQCYVHDGRLSLHMYQRSADVFLGVPFNIASYALLTHVLAHVTGLDVGELIISFGDVHIYQNHMNQVREQMSRRPNPMPTLRIREKFSDLWHLETSDIILEGYDPHPAIKAPISV